MNSVFGAAERRTNEEVGTRVHNGTAVSSPSQKLLIRRWRHRPASWWKEEATRLEVSKNNQTVSRKRRPCACCSVGVRRTRISEVGPKTGPVGSRSVVSIVGASWASSECREHRRSIGESSRISAEQLKSSSSSHLQCKLQILFFYCTYALLSLINCLIVLLLSILPLQLLSFCLLFLCIHETL